MKTNIGRQGSITVYLSMVLFVAVAFVGISFGKPYYHYNTLRSHTKDILNEELGNLDLVKKKVMDAAAELNIPLDENNLEVSIRDKKFTVVKAKWSEVVDFWGYYQKQFDFELEVEV
jgi:hypothetical protein